MLEALMMQDGASTRGAAGENAEQVTVEEAAPAGEAPAVDGPSGPIESIAETQQQAAKNLSERLAETAPIESTNQVITELTAGWPAWSQFLVIALVFTVLLVAIQKIVWRVLRRVSRSGKRSALRKLVLHTGTAAGFLAAGLGLSVGLVFAETRGVVPEVIDAWWTQGITVWMILAATWLVIGVIAGVDDLILSRHRIDVRDNLKARRVHTQVTVISRTMMIIVGIAGFAIALMTFDSVGKIGASLLASAGIAGIAVGFAAKPVLGNIIAGIQIALTQPIRIDDAVILNGEWGWIEEITTTYVVVKIWDERRLIVPFSKIIEEPFENWTRKSANILGNVVLYVDYTCPVDPLRDELDRILDGHPKWDGRAKVLQVIDCTERTLVLRALVTAGDSPTAWELRCDVRERLINFLQREYPWALPREREEKHDQYRPSRHDYEPTRDRDFDDPTLANAPPPPPPVRDEPAEEAYGEEAGDGGAVDPASDESRAVDDDERRV